MQATTLALWLLCAIVAVAAPAKHGKPHVAHTRAQNDKKSEKKRKSGKAKSEARPHGKAAPKSSAKSRALRHKPSVDLPEYEPPTMHRTRTARLTKPVHRLQTAATRLAPMPATNAVATTHIGTATNAATLPLPLAYSPVGADDDAPEVSDAGLNSAVAASAVSPAIPLRAAPVSRRELAGEAVQPVVLPGLYSRTGRLLVPAALKGSREVLVHQNLMADAAGLDRVVDDEDLARLKRLHLLVNLPESESLRVNPQLNADRRCARPWTVKFVTDTARAFHARFGAVLQVNSAVRTVAYQRRLQRTNGNAAAVDGEAASPHLTGQAIDFGKRGMSLAEIAWMRTYLKRLMQAGKVDVEEEFQQACFHISVYRSYMPARRSAPKNSAPKNPAPKNSAPKNQVAVVHPPRVGRSGE